MRNKGLLFLTLLGICAWLPQAARAQSTIFNVPTTDTVAQGKEYVESDWEFRPAPLNNGGYVTALPRFIYGAGSALEVGTNFEYFHSANPGSAEIQPNVKWRFFDDTDKSGLAASLGGIGYLPVTRLQGSNAFGFLYANASEKFKGTYGSRFTFGVYGLINRAPGTGSKEGVMFGYEQPLTSRLSFVTDWLSGTNKHDLQPDRFGYVTPGLALTVNQHSSLDVGYSIGNEGSHNSGMYVWYGWTF